MNVKRWLESSVALLVALFAALVFIPPNGGLDWHHHLKPATTALLHGHSPYSVAGVYNPPWTFLLLAPFTFLPHQVMVFSGLCAYLLTALKLGVSHRLSGLLLLSPPVLMCLGMGNIDWLVLLGLWVRPLWLALFFLAIKPQIGLPFALFRLFSERKPLHGVPVAAALLFSVFLYGPWFSSPASEDWNLSLWPWSAIVGVPLYVFALAKRSSWMVLVITPFLSPYVTAQGYVTTYYGAARSGKRWPFYIALVVGWALLLWRLAVHGIL